MLLDAAYTTVKLGVVSFILGSLIGSLVAAAGLSHYSVPRGIAWVYVSAFRGTPLLIQLLLVYYGLPQLGLRIAAVPSAIIAFSLFASSYLAENFRSGMLAVDIGQWEAAAALGLSRTRTLRRITVPQAFRVALPSIGGRFVAIIKDTSLASVVTVVELTQVANSVGSSTFKYMQAFMMVAIVYWIINAIIYAGQVALERRLGRAYR
jgi:cystine transport system permease protein